MSLENEVIVPTPSIFSLVKELIGKKRFDDVRRYFGQGPLGQQVFDFVISGNKCEGQIPNSEGKFIECSKPAVGSLDFDAGGIGDSALVCGEECFKRIVEIIRAETITQNRPTVIGINGFGRH